MTSSKCVIIFHHVYYKTIDKKHNHCDYCNSINFHHPPHLHHQHLIIYITRNITPLSLGFFHQALWRLCSGDWCESSRLLQAVGGPDLWKKTKRRLMCFFFFFSREHKNRKVEWSVLELRFFFWWWWWSSSSSSSSSYLLSAHVIHVDLIRFFWNFLSNLDLPTDPLFWRKRILFIATSDSRQKTTSTKNVIILPPLSH